MKLNACARIAGMGIVTVLLAGPACRKPTVLADVIPRCLEPSKSPLEPPHVDSITPVISEVAVYMNSTTAPDPDTTRFEVEFYLWSGRGLIPECLASVVESLEWSAVGADGMSVSDWVDLSWRPGYRVLVELHDPPCAASLGPPCPAPEVIVTAKSGSRQAIRGVRLKVTVEDRMDISDLIAASHSDSSAPSASLLRGAWFSGTEAEYEPFAFVNALYPGNLVSGAFSGADSRLAVFSTEAAMYFNSSSGLWSDTSDIVDVGSVQTPALKVPIAMWIGVRSDRAQWTKWAMADLLLANALLTSNRAGIAVELMDDLPESMGNTGTVDCATTAALRGSQDQWFQKGAVNVYYVESLSVGKGVMCPRSAGEEPMVLVARERGATTLSHEIGHVFSLPDFPDVVPPQFTAANLMWPYLSDVNDRGRSHFTLGQVFRMNVDVKSWLHDALTANGQFWANELNSSGAGSHIWLSCQTGWDPGVSTPCPSLSADLNKQ